jgi:hypothetical protein
MVLGNFSTGSETSVTLRSLLRIFRRYLHMIQKYVGSPENKDCLVIKKVNEYIKNFILHHYDRPFLHNSYEDSRSCIVWEFLYGCIIEIWCQYIEPVYNSLPHFFVLILALAAPKLLQVCEQVKFTLSQIRTVGRRMGKKHPRQSTSK